MHHKLSPRRIYAIEQDKAIEKKLKIFNNKTAKKVANDKQAGIGCNGKTKFWYGYKRHLSLPSGRYV